MAAAVKRITLWRTEVEDRPGTLANTIEPPANAGANLQVVMAYRHPGGDGKATVEVYPIAGKKITAAAQAAGLSASAIPALLIEGDNRAGLGHAIAQVVATAGINLTFFVAHVIGRRYSAVAGFQTEDDAKKALPFIRKAALSKKR
jgi:hypothetical protein